MMQKEARQDKNLIEMRHLKSVTILQILKRQKEKSLLSCRIAKSDPMIDNKKSCKNSVTLRFLFRHMNNI